LIFRFSGQSVQSIIGATENLYCDILILFQFIVSTLVDQRADG